MARYPNCHGAELPTGREGWIGPGFGEPPATKEIEPQAWGKLGEVRAGDRWKDEVL